MVFTKVFDTGGLDRVEGTFTPECRRRDAGLGMHLKIWGTRRHGGEVKRPCQDELTSVRAQTSLRDNYCLVITKSHYTRYVTI